MHDSTSLVVTGARAAQCAPQHDPCEVLVDFNVDQVELWDVTNKLAPVLLGAATNPNNRYIHSGWPSADGMHLIFHDELEEIQLGLATQIYTLNLANLRAPTVVRSHVGATSTTDHNGYMRGTYYYVSHYRRGVVVYDAADPNQLVEVAHFDNYVTPSSNVAGTDGTWGVYPFLPSGNLLVSDIENGLFVLRDHTQTLNQNVGRVGFGGLAASGTEGAPSGVRVPVQRVGGLAGNVSVQYSVTAGSATEGVDYVASSGTLSWGAGNNGDKDIVIALPDDTTNEGAETLTVTLSSPTNGATLDGSSILTVTIADNDSNAPPRSNGGGGGGSTDLAWLVALAGTLLISRARRRCRKRLSFSGECLQRRALDARAHVQVALRVRHADALLLETLPDLDQHVALDVLHAVLRIADPKAELQLQRAIAELDEQALGLGIRQHPLRRARRILAERDDLPSDRTRGGRTDVELEARAPLRVGPVFHALGDQDLVRDQVLDAVARHDGDVAAAERRDPAVSAGDGNDVAGLDRLVDRAE